MDGCCAIGLQSPKNMYNIGGVLRAAQCFGASMVAITNRKYRKAGTDVIKAYKHIPLLQVNSLKDIIPYGFVPIGIEIIDNAKCITDYKHPINAFYLFGPEDSSLGKETLSYCKDIIKLPSNHCLNLAACVNCVLFDRVTKQLRK